MVNILIVLLAHLEPIFSRFKVMEHRFMRVSRLHNRKTGGLHIACTASQLERTAILGADRK